MIHNWQEMETAPRDGSRFVLWYAKEKRQYIVYYQNYYERDTDQTWDCIDTCLVVDAPFDHEYRDTIEDEDLVDSYWQPLQTPPQL